MPVALIIAGRAYSKGSDSILLVDSLNSSFKNSIFEVLKIISMCDMLKVKERSLYP